MAFQGCLLLLLACCPAPPATAGLFQQLISEGPAAELQSPLPLPTLSDELNAEQQAAAIAQLVPAEKREQFFRRSLVAPQIVQIDKREGIDHLGMSGVVRCVDFWCVAYGDLAALTQDEFLHELASGVGGHVLQPEELVSRSLPALANNERLAFGRHQLLKKVDLQGTTRAAWTTSPQSILVAVTLDPRFQHDGEFANRWQTFQRNEAGELEPHQQGPFGGAGGYIKLTAIRDNDEPVTGVGPLLVEGHFVFFEPRDWFQGANLLGAKLPALIQAEIRRMRKTIAKTTRPESATVGSEPSPPSN